MPSIENTKYLIKNYLDNLQGLDVAMSWPNQAFEVVYPFVSVDLLYSGSVDDTLKGQQLIDMGVLVLNVAIAENTSDAEASQILDILRVAFKKGVIIQDALTTIEIRTPPRPMNSYQGEVSYHFPLEVAFEAH